ncbi:glycosyltransferase [Paraflavisolibacter sp. H34]|uniref:glycosyltransferase n=1 Tax=Huijunlia imazamoxiresistens TaxID=3127457 RepID=UPI00301B65E8
MAKYSIVLPVRNGGEYIKECIHSILSQSLGDLNLHVLDNNSTDGTLEWVQSLSDSRIVVYPSGKSLTIEENWARITSIPKNEFITLIGHDDILHPHYLQVMDDLIGKYPDASLYQAHFLYIDAQGKTIRKCKPMAERQSAAEFLSFFLCNMMDSMGTGFMMRAADYDAAGGIPAYPNLLFADFDIWIRLIKKSYLAVAFEETFSFRIHQSTTTTSPDVKFQEAFKEFVRFLKSQQDDPLLREAIQRYALHFISFYSKGLAHRLLRTPKGKRKGLTVAAFLSECKQFADELVPGNAFDPEKILSMKLARQIDSNFITRSLFLGFKKVYAKPVLK